MLKNIDSEQFDAVYAILDQSFPLAEKRPYDEQRALLSDPRYQILADYSDEGVCRGLLAVWNLGKFRYIEHFAVSAESRNGGLGTGLLREYLERSTLPVILECEPPEQELAVRRIAFYQRNGFILNPYDYIQPSLSQGRPEIPLRLMSYPQPLTPEEFKSVRKILYAVVYHKTLP